MQYNNIQTSNLNNLFDIYNKYQYNNIFYFEIFAFSYCPIDENINFEIHFDNFILYCFLNLSNKLKTNKNFINKVICIIYYSENLLDLDYYYFQYAKSKNNIFISKYNYKNYLTDIFKEFIYEKYNYCILKTISNTFVKYINKICFIIIQWNSSQNKYKK